LKALPIVLLLAPALAWAAPRAKKPRPRQEARLGGAAKVFARSRVVFEAPADRAQLPPGDVTVRLAVARYPLSGGAHLHLIVDNHPALQVDDVSQPLKLRGVQPGPHVLRAVLCRPWHEVVKAPHAFALARFWSGPRAAGRAGVQAERHAWPDPRRPILTYVLPIGEAPADAPELVSAQEPASARTELEAPMEPTTLPQPSAKTVATPISAAPGNPTPPGLPVLDFYLSRARLARRGFKVLVVLDRFEMPLTRAWEPVRLSRAKAGRHHISVDLLDRMGLKVHGALNQTDRTFHVK